MLSVVVCVCYCLVFVCLVLSLLCMFVVFVCVVVVCVCWCWWWCGLCQLLVWVPGVAAVRVCCCRVGLMMLVRFGAVVVDAVAC